MAGISISDKTRDEIETLAYEQHTSRKDVADKMWEFISKRRDEFVEEVF